jgi:hypothetical protein
MDHPAPEHHGDFEAALHAAARDATGLADFGDEEYLPGLRRLIEAYAKDLPADRATRQACFDMTLPGLVGRLYSERGFAQHPGCLERPIERPLIITGIPRTGTTALHMLLAMDPHFQGLTRWLIPNPIVRPPRELWAEHPLYRVAVRGVEELALASPQAMAAHGIGADDVDECLELMLQSFVTNMIPSLLDLPSYDDWYLAQDEAASYRRLADNLRLIGYAEPEKTWLLKNPTHLLRMETLLSVFPDARIIHTHRAVAPTFSSMCRMLAAFRGDPRPGSAAALAIGPRQLRLYKIATEHTMAVRERQPGAFHDVRQEALLEDPLGVVRGIYEHFELALSSETEARMRGWVAQHPTVVGQAESDPPEGYGLRENDIRRELAPYIERYDLA